MRERDRRLERIADRVGEHAVALEPARALELCRALRMNEDQNAELLHLRPERMELRIAQLQAVDAAAQADAAQSVLLGAFLRLLDREVRMLQRHGRERDEPIRLCRADLCELLVLDLDQLLHDVSVGLVPVRIDAERLDVDALLVHRAEAICQRRARHEERLRLQRPSHQRHRVRDCAVRVHVDGFHALAAHHDFAAPCLRGARAAAYDERDTVRRSRGFLGTHRSPSVLAMRALS